jgi:hypothetical protein
MTVVPIRAIAPAHQSETETAWQVFAALSHFHRNNKDARENPHFIAEMSAAHDRWAALYLK